jgi:glycosyltransferase involved in cell wall biosynthesis
MGSCQDDFKAHVHREMMSLTSNLTVITVVKNGADLLEETIRNVIAQKTTTNLDYFVVDGGSTDGTLEIIRNYSDHITWWVSEPDQGIYDAMNKGWAAAADTSFVLFIGAGDKILSLPDMRRYTQHEVVYGSVMMGARTIFTPRADFHLKLYNSLHHQALLVNKALHSAPPFNCRYRLYADFDFNQRLKKSRAHFVFDPQLVGYASPGGISDHRHFSESCAVIRSNFGFLWVALAVTGYYAMRIIPFLKRLRPLQEL